MKKHILKYYVSIDSFAKLLDVDPALVKKAIDKGMVKVYLVGMNQYEMIDIKKYIHFDFSQSHVPPTKFMVWYTKYFRRSKRAGTIKI